MNGIVFYIIKTNKKPKSLIQVLGQSKSCYYGISENYIYISRKEITLGIDGGLSFSWTIKNRLELKDYPEERILKNGMIGKVVDLIQILKTNQKERKNDR
ncbi:hypothetical protein [Fusobacterium sp.]|uniref:hypothetical protein n=1 Tax=Fusobacterium sp. TaxID=68766 RepID=UPI0029029B96|nr:hypothetical protein [Fusobacterium sp.]MDU1912526.1 hypothetical protein [Fusobacterium sp.]